MPAKPLRRKQIEDYRAARIAGGFIAVAVSAIGGIKYWVRTPSFADGGLFWLGLSIVAFLFWLKLTIRYFIWLAREIRNRPQAESPATDRP